MDVRVSASPGKRVCARSAWHARPCDPVPTSAVCACRVFVWACHMYFDDHTCIALALGNFYLPGKTYTIRVDASNIDGGFGAVRTHARTLTHTHSGMRAALLPSLGYCVQLLRERA